MNSSNGLSNCHLVSIKDMNEQDINKILDRATTIKQDPKNHFNRLQGKILALAFWEPSTRTRISFETAMLRLGGTVTGFSQAAGTSIEKGESLSDTVTMLANYTDGVVIRHPLRGSAKLAAEVGAKYGVSVISGGSGNQEHPTQALLDIFTIREHFNRLTGLNVGLTGDLRYSRTIASLLFALNKFGRNKIYLLSHPTLRLQEELRYDLEDSNLELVESDNFVEIISELDVLYVTRLQKERFPDPILYDRIKGSYQLKSSLLKAARENLIIMHPLPRVDEIPYDIDGFKQARYFQQAENGVYVRMAILEYLLGDDC